MKIIGRTTLIHRWWTSPHHSSNPGEIPLGTVEIERDLVKALLELDQKFENGRATSILSHYENIKMDAFYLREEI